MGSDLNKQKQEALESLLQKLLPDEKGQAQPALKEEEFTSLKEHLRDLVENETNPETKELMQSLVRSLSVSPSLTVDQKSELQALSFEDAPREEKSAEVAVPSQPYEADSSRSSSYTAASQSG